jgi:hypothetical protein
MLCECGYTHAKLWCNECGAYLKRHERREEIPFPHTNGLGMNINIMSWVTTGFETKNDSAGVGQQQFTELDSS